VHPHHFYPTNYSVLRYARKTNSNFPFFERKNILVIQQYYSDVDSFDVIEFVLLLVERADHAINDFLVNDIDDGHR
jgi:hypothetical protein